MTNSISMRSPFLQGAIKPLSYSTTFNSIDGVEDYDGLTLPIADIPAWSETSVNITCKVPFRRVLEVKVLAYDCKEHPLTKAIELGKILYYDVSLVHHRACPCNVCQPFLLRTWHILHGHALV